MAEPTLIDLFCGAGGISHGFEEAGFRALAGIDWDDDSLATFRWNHPRAKVFKVDLASTPPESLAEYIGIRRGALDCLAGGPPCQGFSRNRAFRHVDGTFIDDPRNHLYWNFFEYVDYLRPRTVLIENVPEILIKATGAFQEAVLERFHELGYRAHLKVLNAAEFGVPQHRRRAFFLAGRDGATVNLPQPVAIPGMRAGGRTPSSARYVRAAANVGFARSLFDTLPVGPSVWESMSDLYGAYATELNGETSYATPPQTTYQAARRSNDDFVHNHFRWPLTERQLQRIRLLGQGQGQLHLPRELQTKNGYGSAYRRLQADAQALTITTWMFHPGSGMFTHPYDDRVITIREAARLQSFHDRYRFLGKYHSQCRQVGNAVAPLVATYLAKSVLTGLNIWDQSATTNVVRP